MAKPAVISAKIDPKLKNSAERIFRKLGLTTTQAITLFYKQVDLQRDLLKPNYANRFTKRAL